MRHGWPVLCLMGAVMCTSVSGYAAPKFSRGTAVAGVVAYQDSADKNQFHYLPARTNVVLGGTLKDFKATYWGIGPAQMGQTSTGEIVSLVGAVLSGRAAIDISDEQRKKIVAEIKKSFNVANPKLLPLYLENVKVQPVIAVVTMGLDKGDIVFPSTVAFGTEFGYTIGTGDSRFAQIVAQPNASAGLTTDPHFAVSVSGDVEWEGDEWQGTIDCDLKQVWSEVRKSAGASVGWGWFKFGRSYSDLQKSLEKSGACTFDFKEGSMNNEKYGRQIFEMMKDLFKKINDQATAGEGFFKFEPNPDLGETAGPPSGGGPWIVSINLGYSSGHFKQSIRWKTKVSYTGRFRTVVPASMVLAVDCTSTTQKYFSDVGNTAEACMTQVKIDTFNARLKKELAAKNKLIQRLAERYANGEIDEKQYDKLYALYTRMAVTETAPAAAPTMVRGARVPAITSAIVEMTAEQIKAAEEKALRDEF